MEVSTRVRAEPDSANQVPRIERILMGRYPRFPKSARRNVDEHGRIEERFAPAVLGQVTTWL